ncbi:MAG TPA: thioredoxin family protein [Bacteroidales bacterium]|jgi:thioredoxin 1|nr:thioredoxin family protein [Bacteroidales bacterium]
MKSASILLLSLIISFTSCDVQSGKDKKDNNKYKVTFIELGSTRCIPCQQMQPVMKSVEEKYGRQVKVVFHDVWTEAGAPYGKQYNIEAIPTQVFLDENGKEFFRHIGYFAEEELVKVLKDKGVK